MVAPFSFPEAADSTPSLQQCDSADYLRKAVYESMSISLSGPAQGEVIAGPSIKHSAQNCVFFVQLERYVLQPLSLIFSMY